MKLYTKHFWTELCTYTYKHVHVSIGAFWNGKQFILACLRTGANSGEAWLNIAVQ